MCPKLNSYRIKSLKDEAIRITHRIESYFNTSGKNNGIMVAQVITETLILMTAAGKLEAYSELAWKIKWCARDDSNVRPLPPEGSALSS